MYVYEILEATSGKLISGNKDINIVGFNQDTRKLSKGEMYIPLIGDKFDGHDFIEQAFEAGASAIITSRDVSYPNKVVIKVADTFVALKQMATYLRLHRDVKVIGITGSVGKTSTRDMIYSVVKQKYKTLKTEGNYNNEIGLPLTILRHQNEEVLVLEMGMNHLGEMERLSKIALPDISAITNVGTAHIGELGSRENILKAKLEITAGMKDNSPLIINNDNDMLQQVELNNLKVIRTGKEENDNYLQASNIQVDSDHSEFDLVYNNSTYHFTVLAQGEHNISNALIAIAIGLELDIEMDLIIKGVKEFELTKNRMDVIETHNYTIIDGTYNASVDSMKSSIDVLSNYSSRKIAVLADMLELGDYSKQLHEEVGMYLASKDIDIVICVGRESQYIVDKAIEEGLDEVYHFDSNQMIIDYLKELLLPKDVVLLKGSNGMKLKEIVQAIK